MNAQTLRNDIQATIKAQGINLYKLAQMAGVSQSSLWLFVNCQREAISTDTLFRLWPHIYGEQSPTLLQADDVVENLPDPEPATSKSSGCTPHKEL